MSGARKENAFSVLARSRVRKITALVVLLSFLISQTTGFDFAWAQDTRIDKECEKLNNDQLFRSGPRYVMQAVFN